MSTHKFKLSCPCLNRQLNSWKWDEKLSGKTWATKFLKQNICVEILAELTCSKSYGKRVAKMKCLIQQWKTPLVGHVESQIGRGGAWCKNGSNFMKFIEAACLLQFRGYSLTKYLSHIFKVDSSKMGRHISIKPILWH